LTGLSRIEAKVEASYTSHRVNETVHHGINETISTLADHTMNTIDHSIALRRNI
jgi:hypothetical protein